MPKINLELAQSTVLPRAANSYKGTYGHLMTIGGNQNFGGAIIMSASAAVYSGAGLVTAATDPLNFTALHARLPESMVMDYQDFSALEKLIPTMDVIIIGPGLGTDAASERILEFVFNHVTTQQHLIIDGSALTLLSKHLQLLPKTGHLVFTPHQIEWQRLSQLTIPEQSDTNNKTVLKQFYATNPDLTLVLKSNQTKVYLPNGEVWVNTAGNPGMATGGSGDTLTGILGAFLCQFKPTDKAILAGVYTHSAVADALAKQNYVTLPQEIIPLLPKFMHALAH